jgi:hypothetical protein
MFVTEYEVGMRPFTPVGMRQRHDRDYVPLHLAPDGVREVTIQKQCGDAAPKFHIECLRQKVCRLILCIDCMYRNLFPLDIISMMVQMNV